MGHKSFSAAKAASRLNMEIMMWGVNSKDTRCDTPAIIQSVLAEAGEKDIVLFHDGVYKWTQPERNATVEALPVILEKIVKKFTTDNPQIS
jgi:peptidoglycan/xylan/chitin deacetylase (PgdA/CDA1 family)